MNLCFNRSWQFTSFALWLAVAAGGCAVPSGANVDRVAMPGGNTAAIPASQRPRALAAIKQSLQSSTPQPYRQVAHYQPNSPAGVAQTGHITPARLGGACACGSCGGAQDCQTPAPFGYIMQSPQGWNAHGIDPQEFICDGGDQNPAATLRRDDSIAGLGLEDTVVHYTTDAGDIHFQPSNRTCLYAPRFSSVRKITGALAGGRAIGLAGVDRPLGPIRVEHDLPGLVMSEATELAHADVARRIDAMRERNRGVPVEAVQQLEQADDVMAALAALKLYDLGETKINELALLEKLAQAAVPWTFDNSLEVIVDDLKTPTLIRDQSLEAFTIYEFPDAGRLRIVKLADRSDALPGESVKFAIRVDNVGDSAVGDVVLADNLTTRLQYVPESQECEGAEAEFTTTANEGQSLRLQWKLKEELKVGQSVTIHFECKVR